jgi:signal transduction histidine kinase
LESLKGYLPDRGVRIALQISSVSTVQADPSILRMIFENLLTNGIKYSKSNGEVTLTVQMQKAGAIVDGRPCVQDSLQIEVRDDGIEILIHEQDKVFTKLFRGENARAAVSNGNGLGLYLVKSIVDQMHGDIWFHSGEGHGTVFFVVLPLEGLGTATKRHEKDNTV